jgi:hypothetical protein
LGLYNAEISAGSLMLPESRRIAQLLLTHPTPEQWDEAMKSENLLQKKPATARRQARLIRNRLATLDDDGLQIVAEGDGELSTQVLLLAAARHSLLLSDFLRDVYGADLRRLERTLSHRQWEAFLTECEHRDPAVGAWAETTREALPGHRPHARGGQVPRHRTPHGPDAADASPEGPRLPETPGRRRNARPHGSQSMKTSFDERLNQVLPRLASPDVLDNRGAGGEIGFWVFDYPPEHEMQMRSWLTERDRAWSAASSSPAALRHDRSLRVRHQPT